ncbi:hypothetical protein ACEWY4_025039 [Coilia grayii]|uniref:C-type lectin domain-containing protein n=1 Tax=Coilia grayii TaxID=363190 RepID=A0ABD1IWE9_9TELE
MKLSVTMGTLSIFCLLYAGFALSVAADEEARVVRASCAKGWTEVGRRCFRWFNDSHSWSVAEEKCVGHGAHLVTIFNEEEQKAVSELSNRIYDKTWIGGIGGIRGKDKAPQTYTWIDGTEITGFKHWANGEPNNSGDNEHCMSNDPSKDFHWNDDTCHIKLAYMCAYNA